MEQRLRVEQMWEPAWEGEREKRGENEKGGREAKSRENKIEIDVMFAFLESQKNKIKEQKHEHCWI